MTVVENGSLSKAARVMNRTTPPVAKSIKDFECIIGKKLFKREKCGMRLTNEGEILYQELKELYQQEKEITRKYQAGHVTNTVDIYYDWVNVKTLNELFDVAAKNNIIAHIKKLPQENINDMADFNGNILIITSERIISEKFSLVKEVKDVALGVYAKKDIISKSKDVMSLLHDNIWLCNPTLFKSDFIKSLEQLVMKDIEKVDIRQIDNMACCLKFVNSGDYVCITNSKMDDFDRDPKLDFVHLKGLFGKNSLYFYQISISFKRIKQNN